MLYEIREENGKFKLFFRKKNGFKFKKTFLSREDAEDTAKLYLRYCCLECLHRGWAYKTRDSGGLRGGGNRHGAGNRRPARWGKPKIGSPVFCPECRTNYLVQYESEQVESWAGNSTGWHKHIRTVKHFLLTPSPE